MIFTIGYGNDLTVEGLQSAIKENAIDILIDLRSKPYSQWQYKFNRKNLQGIIPQYQWRGDILGGFSQIEEENIDALAVEGKDKNLLLMCAEKDHKKCHRETIIGARLKVIGYEYQHLIR